MLARELITSGVLLKILGGLGCHLKYRYFFGLRRVRRGLGETRRLRNHVIIVFVRSNTFQTTARQLTFVLGICPQLWM